MLRYVNQDRPEQRQWLQKWIRPTYVEVCKIGTGLRRDNDCKSGPGRHLLMYVKSGQA
jgi:hypothetical protein